MRSCQFEFSQPTGERGRPSAKVRHGRLQLSLDVPAHTDLLAWAAAAHKPLSGHVTFYETDERTARETVSFTAGHCVGYHETFQAGNTGAGAYVCHLVIATEQLTLKAGGADRQLLPAPIKDYKTAPPMDMAAMAIGGAGGVGTQALNEMKEELVAASKKRADMLVAEREGIKTANVGKKDKHHEIQTVTSPVTASIADPKVIDPTTGKPAIYQGENFKVSSEYGRIAFAKFKEEAHPILRARIEKQEALLASGWKPKNRLSGRNPGAHAEIVATDKALKAREGVGLIVDDTAIDEIYLHNRSLLVSQYPDGSSNMCDHCERILAGINPIGHE